MIKLNKEQIRDKIYACWIGKNIGGTIGGPFEWEENFVEVTGFTTPKGEPLPNDDLDLQLVFLRALEKLGPAGMSPSTLAEYWVHYIPGAWNEYGIAKSNLRMGILPPLSGEIFNDKWKISNGAWIRSELWACLTPGFPEIAAHYAFMDACVDHGMSEGTHSEIFTTYLECNAFFNNNIRQIIDSALAAIPADSRVADSVRLAIDCYDRGMSLRDARETLVARSKDLGMFQSPANIGFTILGLLYGEGDFKKSVLSAVSCGDDADCTGATVGAVMGILYGTAGIPQDWREYIGDEIINIAIDRSFRKIPKTCTELTDRIMELILPVLRYHEFDVCWTEAEHQLQRGKHEKWCLSKIVRDPFADRKRYCYDVYCSPTIRAIVNFDSEPIIKENGDLGISVGILNTAEKQISARIKLHLPEGFHCEYPRNLRLGYYTDGYTVWNATVKAGDVIEPMNRIIMEVDFAGLPMPALIPINILG